MLNPHYRYIGIDFETTGLDTTKDEPIQIGIVEIDTTGKILNEFSSLLKPTKDLRELKSIVGFITGLSVEKLADAPSPADISPQIQQFFGPNTILIGHNISFDTQFLQKFFPSCEFANTIDTFPLAQTLLHYQASYALEVLIPGANAHDALQDTKNALTLFTKIVDKILTLAKKYPILTHYISQETFSLSQYLASPLLVKGGAGGRFVSWKIKDIPKLTKHLPPNLQFQPHPKSISTDTLENQKRYFVGNLNLKTFLERIAANKNIIIAFANLQKLDIAKNLLLDMGIKNIWFLKDEQLLDYEKFEHFLDKPQFTNPEIGFILKYYSHLDQGLGILDLNSKYDHQIYHALKNRKNKTRYPIVLATHQGLFSQLQDGENEYPDYEIFFLDSERWYKSYNFFLSRPLDMYYTLTLIENLLYKQHLDAEISSRISPSLSREGLGMGLSSRPQGEHLTQFYTSFQIFMGQLSMESKNLFINRADDNYPCDPIVGNSAFYKTNLLRNHIRENYTVLQEELEPADFLLLEKQILHIDNLFNTLVTIQRKMMNDEVNFVYSENTQFTSRPEFIDLFPNNIYFFSVSDKQGIHLFPEEKIPPSIPTIKIPLYERVIGYITDKPDLSAICILSTRKEESKQLFDLLYKYKLHEKYTILVENITWGVGKNLSKAKDNKPKIIIGGFAFLLSIYANKIPLDEIIIFNIRGANEQNILDDIGRYGAK